MQIISLECKRCGAPLQIREGVDQLACRHCGAQMYVERGGGAISLQLVEALGSIRTGAVQTAAELALVRLARELEQTSPKVAYLESVATSEAQARESFKQQDLISELEFAAANDLAVALKSEIARNSIDLAGISAVGLIAIVLLRVWMVYTQSGLFEGLLALIGWGIVWVIAFIGIAFFTSTNDIRRENRLKERLRDVEDKIARHQTALAMQNQLSDMSNTLKQLPDTRAELARIQEEIARNRRIVS